MSASPARQAVALLATDAEGRVLLQLRDDRPGLAMAGQFGPFGGEVEPGETALAALCREVREELGLCLAPEVLTLWDETRGLVRDDTALTFFTMTASLQPVALRLGEGAGFAFLTARQCESWPMPGRLRPLLARFFAERATGLAISGVSE